MQVEQGVPGQRRQHVVEEAHTRGDVGLARAVERQAQADAGLSGGAGDLGRAVHRRLIPQPGGAANGQFCLYLVQVYRDAYVGRMSQTNTSHDPVGWHGTTILCVRRDGRVAMAGDGQVSLGQTVVKGNARKVRRIGGGTVLAGFAGATADAFTLLERLEAKLERYPSQL